MRRYIWILGTALMVLTASVAKAGPIIVTYDTSPSSPSGNPSDPGWYSGTGNPNDGFTLFESDGVELFLRAKHRQDPAVIHTPTNVYDVEPGPQSGAVTNRAWWNYEFGFNLRPDGIGTMVLDDVVLFSSMTISDLTTGDSITFNPFLKWSDFDTWGPGGEVKETLANQLVVFQTSWGAENSQNPNFGDFPLLSVPGYSYDMNAEHYYRVGMDIRNREGSLVAGSIDIRVGDAENPEEVPEPVTLSMMGMGLIFLAMRMRRHHLAIMR